jgi:hypothetical protein
MQNYLMNRATPIVLRPWVVIEVPSPRPTHWDRHVVGFANSQICISPPIRSFDANRAVAHCWSHRSLSLEGEPGWTSETRRAWHSWKLLNGVTVDRDISPDVYQAMKTIRTEVIS